MKIKIVLRGGGFCQEIKYRKTLKGAQAVVDDGFRLKYQTRHKVAHLFRQTEDGQWEMFDTQTYKP